MANILLTTRCNLNCPYCFAQERLGDDHKLAMSISNVEKVIAFLNRSGHPVFRAMGGEPTLHPEFPQIVQMALEAGMRVDVLSNATWPDAYNALFSRISPQRLFFLLNIDAPGRYLPKTWQRIEHNLAAVAARGSVTLSFNIFETHPNYEYILELSRKYHIDKLRMSFSLPILGANNAHMKLEDYRSMAPFMVEFVRRAEAIGVQVNMDNALPLCMFTYEQAGELLLKGVLDFKRNSRCQPVIDIGPDLKVWCCFCLSKLWNRHLDEFQTLQEIQDYYSRAMSLYQGRLFPMEDCLACKYREQWGCQGGCLTFTANQCGELALEDVPQQPPTDGWQPGTILALSPDVELQHYDIPQDSYALYSKQSGLEMEVDARFQPLLTLLNGQSSPKQVVEQFAASGEDAQAQGPLGEFATLALKRGANELLHGMLQRGFVVERQVSA
jgi:sulfatase maturation enzyme AslB (radical SAM superfamily)